MDEILKIRKLEKEAHEKIYTSEKLFEGDTWLKKPVKTVIDLCSFFEENKKLNVLDLGCGVGRNCIPIAQKYNMIDCKIDCVDILELAIEKLNEYSKKYEVYSHINGIAMPLENFEIKEDYYDLILAISSLEHVNSEETFWKMIKEINNGIKEDGIVCFIFNSNVLETDKETGAEYKPQFEVNLKTDLTIDKLREIYSEWEIIKQAVVSQEYDIPRDKLVNLTTDVITWVARKK